MSRICDNPERREAPASANHIVIELSDTEAPKFVVNGVDIAPNITTDWSLSRVGDNDGRLTVSFPVVLP